MKNELTCNIVRDLLPSYVDGLTSKETNESIEIHLKECKECTQIYTRMKQSAFEFEETKEEKRNIDFMKKAKERFQRKMVLAGMGGIFLVVTVLLINVFFIGKKVKNPDLIQAEISVENQHVVYAGNLTDSGKGVSDVYFENKDGILTITVKETAKSKFHSNDFSKGYDSQTPISQIWVSNRIIWDSGEEISAEVALLYDTRHPYVGDMPANEKTAVSLGIRKELGSYSNELQTTKEPYGWKLIGEQDYKESSQKKIESRMSAYSCALIALTDNLGYVTFEYTVEGETKILTTTEQDADTLVGQSVKEMAKTPCGLQQLMKILNLTEGYLLEE